MNNIIFINTGWMDFYKGLSSDKITGGGKHVDTHGWGAEIFNFKNHNGMLYGFGEVGGNVNLNKLGASSTDNKIDNMTIVWTAREPNKGGTYIIGWYKNATLYRQYQEPSPSLKRVWNGNKFGFYATAKYSDCKLLSKDERVVKVPRGKSGMGQHNLWYADKKPDFVKLVYDYIYKGVIPKRRRRIGKKGTPRQVDPMKRLAVETKAVKEVIKHYKKLGYEIDSVEKDNIGWDLTATNNDIELKLEVKGLSGVNIATELTPNEFKNLKADKLNYRLCIVTETMTSPRLNIFAFSNDTNKWTSEDGMTIEFEEVMSARVYSS